MSRVFGPAVGAIALAASEVMAGGSSYGNETGGGRKRLRGGKRIERELHPAAVKKPKSEGLKKMLSGKPKRV